MDPMAFVNPSRKNLFIAYTTPYETRIDITAAGLPAVGLRRQTYPCVRGTKGIWNHTAIEDRFPFPYALGPKAKDFGSVRGK